MALISVPGSDFALILWLRSLVTNTGPARHLDSAEHIHGFIVVRGGSRKLELGIDLGMSHL